MHPWFIATGAHADSAGGFEDGRAGSAGEIGKKEGFGIIKKERKKRHQSTGESKGRCVDRHTPDGEPYTPWLG